MSTGDRGGSRASQGHPTAAQPGDGMEIVAPSPEYISAAEAARRWGVTTKTVRRAVQAGHLPRRYVPGRRGLTLALTAEELQAWREGARPRGRPAGSRTAGRAAEPHTATGVARPAMGRRVAAINDDATFLALLVGQLHEAGYEALSHRGTTGAHRWILAHRPEAIVLDIRLEHPDAGWRVLEALTLDPATSDIPVIVCSADHRELEEQAGHLRAVGAVPLGKPFQMPALLAALDEVLRPERLPAG